MLNRIRYNLIAAFCNDGEVTGTTQNRYDGALDVWTNEARLLELW